jgi:phospholipase C
LLIDSWRVSSVGASEFDLSVYGPNGFFRGFKGTISGSQRAILDVHADYDEDNNTIRLEISNRSSRTARITVMNVYRSRSMTTVLGSGDTDSKSWSLSATGGWYDLIITVDGDPHFEYRLAGHLEDGEDSISDPAMGALV